MKVLLVKTSSMGDVIHSFPAVTDALGKVPGLRLDWVVEEAFAGLVELHPGISAIHKAAARRWRSSVLSSATLGEIGALRARLRGERYDLVIDAQGLLKSAFVARLAGAPIAGFDRRSVREPVAAIAYSTRISVDRKLHAVTRTRLLLGEALGYAPDLSTTDFGLRQPADEDGGSRTAFLLHGTNWNAKKWPLENWTQLAGALVARGLRPVVTWSSDTERLIAEALAASVPDVAIIPRAGLTAIAGEIARSAIVVGVDTGLTHLAAAFDRPTVALFLATLPGLTGPLGGNTTIVAPLAGPTGRPRRSQNQRAAMLPADAVSPARVIAAVDAVLMPNGA